MKDRASGTVTLWAWPHICRILHSDKKPCSSDTQHDLRCQQHGDLGLLPASSAAVNTWTLQSAAVLVVWDTGETGGGYSITSPNAWGNSQISVVGPKQNWFKSVPFNCSSLGKLLKFLELQFPHPYNGDNIAYLTPLSWKKNVNYLMQQLMGKHTMGVSFPIMILCISRK